MPHSAPLPADLEPLDRLARFAFDHAPSLCRPEHGCTDYHRVWSAIRLFDLGGATPAGWPFFRRELQALATDRPLRVLLSGAADTGLASIVAAALPPERALIVLTDRCETPIAQNRQFAQALGRPIECHVGDVRALACDPVDAVLAHSFLVFFDPEERQRVVDAWARVLAPGGRLLMSNRLVARGAAVRPPPDTAAALARLPALREKAAAAGWNPVDCDLLAEAAGRFWTRSLLAPLTESGLRDLLSNAGLELVALDYDDSETPTGPMSRRHRTRERARAEIVARKPG